MVEYKLNIGDAASKKTLKKDVKDTEAEIFQGKKIGDTVKGDLFGLNGYELTITGGSDSAGFPMRRDVMGGARKKILIVKGTGLRKNEDGRKIRKTVAGNTITTKTVQINLKVTKAGKTPLFEEAKPEEASKEEKSEEKPTNETKKE
ncbi:MAG: 30S ribosomal protein S6e [Candidatus Woesearchaeota archaeon]